jgi:hypothetical protein
LSREHGGSELPWIKSTVGAVLKNKAAKAATDALIASRCRSVREPDTFANAVVEFL